MLKNLPASAEATGDAGSIPGSGRSTRVGNGNPLQCSCLGNFMDNGGWWTTVHAVSESDTTERMNTHTYTHTHTSKKFTILTIFKHAVLWH